MTTEELFYKRLAAAVVLQAVTDWKTLCNMMVKGKIIERNGAIFAGPTHKGYTKNAQGKWVGEHLPHFNFIEIRTFIETSADFYCNMLPEEIMPTLENELAHARIRAKSKFGKP